MLMLCGCGQTAGEKATVGDAERAAAISVTEAPTETPEPTPLPTATPAPTDTPTPTPSGPTEIPTYEEAWKYSIVRSGYYNACAKWDADGNLLEGPDYTPGNQIYYNDCDEYYDNFVAKENVFGKAMISLDDEVAHSGDNSLKITGRVAESGGFSGFGFRLSDVNVLDINELQGKEVTLGFWIYYSDDFDTGVAESFDFAVWSNLNPGEDKPNEQKLPDPEYLEKTAEMTDEEKKEVDELNKKIRYRYDKAKYEMLTANRNGFYKIAEMSVPSNTWKYFEVTTKINTKSKEPMFAVATLGELNSANLTFYNPFYIDDIILTVNEEKTEEENAETTEDAEKAGV